MKRTMIAVILLASMLIPALSMAQVRGGSRRVIELGEDVIEGRIEKPEAYYILRPTSLNYETVAMQETFIPELLNTVMEEPF